MATKSYKAYTPSRRNMTTLDYSEITKKTPEKSLLAVKKEKAGRNRQQAGLRFSHPPPQMPTSNDGPPRPPPPPTGSGPGWGRAQRITANQRTAAGSATCRF